MHDIAVKLAAVAISGLVLLATAGCGYDASATFNDDGSVTVGLKFLFPKDLMSGTNGASISGFSPSDLSAANTKLQAKYPGATIAAVTKGDESGAEVTIPFATEKDAFAFLTSPPQMTAAGATSGTGLSLNLSNTGGLFTSATHTAVGGVDTYTFMTAAQPPPSPSPGQQQVISSSELASVFTVTFAITVPHDITSAPGAVFTFDRKTAIWKLDWTKSETLTATTGPETEVVAAVGPATNDQFVGFIVAGILAGIAFGMLMPWRRMRRLPAPASETPPVETPPES